jgi:HD-like signal output (HDOD) protein
MAFVYPVSQAAIPTHLIEQLHRGIGRLQMLPEAAQQALAICNSPDCNLIEVATMVQRDVKLATFILRLANSSLFAPPRPIASLNHAVMYIGRRRARDFIISASLEAVGRSVPAELQARQAALWLHGFYTGILAVKINDLFGMSFQGEEFTAGLMHDFGRTLLSIADPLNCLHVDALEFDEPADIETREKTYFGVSHADLGGWFAAVNELPESLVRAIQYHHRPEDAGDVELPALIAAADHAANVLQRGGDPREYDPKANHGIRVLEESGVPRATRRFADCIRKLLEETPKVAEQMMGA